MTHDKVSFAQIRNRAEQCQLTAELQRIEKEKKNELRIYNTERQRFKSKYSKLNLVSRTIGLKDNIYHTRLDYGRNGEQKQLIRSQIISTIEFKQVHNLVFTRNEVDIEKIICLHMISAHRTETLTPPKRKFRYMCKEHSPSEKLLERSRRGYSNDEVLTSLMPFYTIELMELGAMGENVLPPVINDGRLAARILVNKQIRDLIGTVVRALHKSNKEKLKQLSSLASDTTVIKEILGKKHILSFMDKLRDLPFVTSCDSYVLTPPFKIKTRDLNLRTLSGHVEDLIKHIRQNVLQYPKRRIIKLTQDDRPSANNQQTHRLKKSVSEKFHPKVEMDNISTSSKGSRECAINSARRSSEADRRYLGITNYIAKNIKGASKIRKIEYQDDDSLDNFARRPSKSSRRTSRKKSDDMPTVSIASTVTERPSSEQKIELKNMEDIQATNKRNNDTQHMSISPEKPKRKRSSIDECERKYYIKQNTCPACMQKWKTPLPSPKTPRVKTSSVVPTPLLKTNSMNRLSMMINKEMYTLESYDRKYAPENQSTRKCRAEKRVVSDSSDNVNVSPMDLARIEQEIKEKETKKKLEKFLNEKV